MFDYTLIHWITFLTAATLLNLSPGPGIAFILGQTFSNGRPGGFVAMSGIWTGTFLHVAMAALGLSAILVTSAVAFTAVKWAGAAYLIWLGLEAFFSGNSLQSKDNHSTRQEFRTIYWQAVLVSAINPKVAIFFLAFLPQFVVEGAGPVSAQLFLHGSLIIVISVLIDPLLVISGSRLSLLVKNNYRVGLWLRSGLGTLFISLGIRLAISDRT